MKGVNFVNLRDAGDPVQIARSYDEAGADELVFLDITASSDSRDTMVDVVRRVSEEVFIPLTVGGGIRSVEDMRRMLRAGADKSLGPALKTNSVAARHKDPVRDAFISVPNHGPVGGEALNPIGPDYNSRTPG